ncbi:LuxQ periplasmic sensor domain-containing protein [Aliivibrio sp. S4TY2]|uniref:LuxQ periplasmic sensor domain-containing protein n=1 Tax=unclassified Aliivibrio TaxID=2645654 RepID=UPI002378F1D4|nr:MULTISPECIES: LuxQ periplasmic sensor domain-containing protein [unclassified Aliivibrio]MDD9157102.1 LuxQ periplasmic sensor domain-containing protein [Aliivibrio sp. S4TY2]MDD9161065.1 LuxQ periplasmic sensor domain-containing protein [Aliivibrio sp. S4TY1]MDD9165014.1 LuxQ periplasmic sensor domain-containing protein [Aliivibrio sp. S4MY2]MDD9169093.1 LuxQ periplasmic sensor domain-containing protein [Aliivibrio sp. S4MY4]MDD9185821.1 LuxQ periplasmic sensor domain-containing protein [Al
MNKENVLKKASLADLIFRAIFVIFSILTVGITIHTYQLSINTINEEVKRNLQQTSSLVTNFLNHRLAILQIRQDTDAGSLGLQDGNNTDRIRSLEHYFSDIEAKSPYNSPDFRFIEVDNMLYWNDGNNLFLGLDEQDLQEILDKNIHINTWYYMMIDKAAPQAHLLIRKTPVVTSSTGRVRGYLYNAAILNNNISFVHDLKKISNTQEVLIVNDNNVIASSLKYGTKEYSEIENIISDETLHLKNRIVNVTGINIKSLNGKLSILTLKNKENIELLEQRFIYSVVLSFFVLIAIAVLIRGLFEHKIVLALNSLLKYADDVSKKNSDTQYQGSGILEFDNIGHKLEETFIELIEAKEESYKAQAAAEKSTQVKSDFLARMSHEIRTPLNGILGISSLLKQSDLTVEQRKQVAILHQGGEHLLAVLNDVLDFSQIEQDKLNISCEPFKLSDVLETINAIYTPLCCEKGIYFIIHNKIDENALINSDQVRLTQILFNLLSNAVKFTEFGNVKLTLSLKTKNDQIILYIDVADTGIGMDRKEQALIFEPFIQAESTEIRRVGGSGLGLAIVKQLLNLLNGKISVQSKSGGGSVFYVQVPVAVIKTVDANIESQGSTYESLLPTGLNVLLIEDNKSNAYIAKAYCQKYGLSVDWQISAQNGINQLLERSFDLILMDNQMPGMSGIEATKYIRDVLKLNTPIYAYTADVLKESNEEFLMAGANYVITKPIKEKSILDALVFYKLQCRN